MPLHAAGRLDEAGLDASTVLGVSALKVSDLALLNVLLGTAEGTDNVGNEAGLGIGALEAVEGTGLVKVVVGEGRDSALGNALDSELVDGGRGT